MSLEILKLKLDGREVVDAELAGLDSADYPDFCDAYFDRAFFADTGEALEDEQLDRLAEQNPDELHILAHRTIRYGGRG